MYMCWVALCMNLVLLSFFYPLGSFIALLKALKMLQRATDDSTIASADKSIPLAVLKNATGEVILGLLGFRFMWTIEVSSYVGY